jgi:uncharacterized membrane protein
MDKHDIRRQGIYRDILPASLVQAITDQSQPMWKRVTKGIIGGIAIGMMAIGTFFSGKWLKDKIEERRK